MEGFELIPEVISDATESELIWKIKSILPGIAPNPYGKEERSRVKRYGYDYTKTLKKLEPIPDWLKGMRGQANVTTLHFMRSVPFVIIGMNSITINEYQPGHGIMPHVDADYFGPVIAILSLGGSATMLLSPPDPGRTESPLPPQVIPPRSLVVLSGEARKTWKHSIDGKSVKETRYSIVFRERKLKHENNT